MKALFKRVFCLLLVAQAALGAILADREGPRGRKAPKARKAILTWDRNEEFNRREDRERCELKS